MNSTLAHWQNTWISRYPKMANAYERTAMMMAPVVGLTFRVWAAVVSASWVLNTLKPMNRSTATITGSSEP